MQVSRSLNESLTEGSTDGKYRKTRPNTFVDPGMGDDLVKANRKSLHPFWNYDFIDSEDPAKVSPGAIKAADTRSRKNVTPVSYMDNNMMGQTY